MDALEDLFWRIPRLVIVLFQGFIMNGGELFVEVMVPAPNADGNGIRVSHSAI